MKNIAPYQLYFPLGIFAALLAVGVWTVQDLNWFRAPAIFIHSKLIAGGFIWSFITGFLMTAIPRMTGTAGAHISEYLLSGILLLAMILTAWAIDPRYFYAFQIALVSFIIIYAVRRILKMSKPLPVFFSHVGMAMILALVGSYFHFTGQSYMGIHLYHVGTTLLLVLGIGTRFFSFLSGLASEFENSGSPGLRMLFHVSGVAIAVLLYLAGRGVEVAYLFLGGVTLSYLFLIWKVQRKSSRPSALKYAVRFVALSIPLSFFMTWLHPAVFLTWFHVLFIGCFSLITFSVATRVTLAHGSYPTDLEMKSLGLWYVFAFLVGGVLARIGYGYADGMVKKGFLHLAVLLWLLAVFFWCWTFLPKIFKPGPMAKPSC